MATKTKYRVNREGYTYRGKGIPVGSIVELSPDQAEHVGRIQPPYLVPVSGTEAKNADVVALSEIPELDAPTDKQAGSGSKR